MTGVQPASECDTCTGCALVHNVLTWQQPIISASALVAMNLGFFLFLLKGYSILSLASYAGVCVLALGFVGSWLFGYVPEERVEVISKNQTLDLAERLYDRLNSTASGLCGIVLWKNRWESLRFAGILLAIAYTTSWFTLSAIIFLAGNSAFAAHFLANLYKLHVKHHVEQLKGRISDRAHVLIAKIPRMQHAKAQ